MRVAAIVRDAHVILEHAFVEGAAIDEGPLERPRVPHQVAAGFIDVEHGRADVVFFEKLHRARGILPVVDA